MARRWSGPGLEPAHTRQFANVTSTTGPACGVGLLGEVLARLPGVKKPMIQVIAGSPSGSAMTVARALAISAAQRYGRTLLVSPDEPGRHGGSVRGLSWLMSELSTESADAKIPDSGVARLYHMRLRSEAVETAQLQLWFAEPHDISLIVVCSQAIAVEPSTIALACGCHGSLLAVEAGRSRAEEISAQIQQLACASVRVLGSVLYNAPGPFIGLLRPNSSK